MVQGKSAEDLLSQKAPAGGSPGGGGVQRKALQLDIKADLRKAMEGWGTDEAYIFQSCQTAPIGEVTVGQSVEVYFEQHEDVWLPMFRPAGAAA